MSQHLWRDDQKKPDHENYLPMQNNNTYLIVVMLGRIGAIT